MMMAAMAVTMTLMMTTGSARIHMINIHMINLHMINSCHMIPPKASSL